MSAPRLRATSLLAVLVVAGSSCAVTQDATSWEDPKAKEHFLASCTGDAQVVKVAGKNEVRTSELASKGFCTCVFEDLTTKHKLAWDDMLAYEKRQADAKDGSRPEPPSQVTKAIDACRSADAAGPTVPDSE